MVHHPPRRMPAEGSTVTFDTVPDVLRVEDLFALAMAIEREAADRYTDLAASLESRAEGEDEHRLAALFRRLAEAEADHEAGIGAWAGRRGIAPSEQLRFRWDGPETPGPDDLPPMASPYQALAMAVRNEERAFSFYAQVAAKTHDAAVRDYAERMAREELDHVALLRRERRWAYREEREAVEAALPAAGPPRGRDVADLMAYVRDVERECCGRLRAKAHAARAAGAARHAALFRDLADEAEARARGAGATSAVPDQPPPEGAPGELARDEERRQARLYDGWMALIERARDEALLRAAQEETSVVLSRLARLRDIGARAP